MKILAMDPSLSAYGLACWEDGEIGTDLVSPSSRGPARVHEILLGIKGYTEGLDLALMESFAFGARGGQQGTINTAEMRGVVSYYLWQYRVPLVEVSAPALKIFAAGKGNAPKNQVLIEAVKRLGYEGHSDDIADALWILHMALAHYDLPGAVQLPQTHTRALNKIQWPELDTPKDLREVA